MEARDEMNTGELNALASARTRAVRIRRGLTQKQAAELAGVDLRHYRKIEAGGCRNIRLATVGKLARAFGLEAWHLIAADSSCWNCHGEVVDHPGCSRPNPSTRPLMLPPKSSFWPPRTLVR